MKVLRRMDLLIFLSSVYFVFEFLFTLGDYGVSAWTSTYLAMTGMMIFLIGFLSYLGKKFNNRMLNAIVNALVISSFLYILMWDVLSVIPVIGALANDFWIFGSIVLIAIFSYKKNINTKWTTVTVLLVVTTLFLKSFDKNQIPVELFSYGIREIVLQLGWLYALIGIAFAIFTTKKKKKVAAQPSKKTFTAEYIPHETTTQTATKPEVSQPKPKKSEQARVKTTSNTSSKDYNNIEF